MINIGRKKRVASREVPPAAETEYETYSNNKWRNVNKNRSVPWECIEARNDINIPENRQDNENIFEVFKQ